MFFDCRLCERFAENTEEKEKKSEEKEVEIWPLIFSQIIFLGIMHFLFD